MENVLCMNNLRERCEMYNIGICDDGIKFCSQLESMIWDYAERKGIKVDIKVWYSGESLCEYLKSGNHLDIVFLDIELLKTTGIEVGNYIRETLGNRGMSIVYISGKASYAQQLFKTQPVDFLVKPVSQDMLDETLDLVIKIVNRGKEKFEFQKGKDYYYISYKDIIYFCSEGRKVKIITKDGILDFYGKLNDIIAEIPKEFVQIHQSFIVNKEHISRYTYETVELVDRTVLSISKVNRKRVREDILKAW